MTTGVLGLIFLGIYAVSLPSAFWFLLQAEKSLQRVDDLNDDTKKKLLEAEALNEQSEKINQETAEILANTRRILDN